jgi:hypothetical protein
VLLLPLLLLLQVLMSTRLEMHALVSWVRHFEKHLLTKVMQVQHVCHADWVPVTAAAASAFTWFQCVPVTAAAASAAATASTGLSS